MKNTDACLYQAHEFARRTGTTVRTLHHYDRLGLLKPTNYTAAGYRLYGESDFARLQQIVTLKFIGLSLKQIKEVLAHSCLDLAATLRLQRAVIEEKRRRLEMAAQAIERAEQLIAANDRIDWEAFKKIIEVISMENNMEWVKKYYTEDQLADLSARWSPEVQEKASRDWAALLKDVGAAIKRGENPASETAQALAARWSKLIDAFTDGNPAIMENLKKLYADQPNWPSDFQRHYSNEAMSFIGKAMAAGKTT